MANRNINGFNVEYNEESDTVSTYLEHLQGRISKEEMAVFVENAKNDEHHKVHLEDNHNNKITLEYIDDENCLIRKRQD